MNSAVKCEAYFSFEGAFSGQIKTNSRQARRISSEVKRTSFQEISLKILKPLINLPKIINN